MHVYSYLKEGVTMYDAKGMYESSQIYTAI